MGLLDGGEIKKVKCLGVTRGEDGRLIYAMLVEYGNGKRDIEEVGSHSAALKRLLPLISMED